MFLWNEQKRALKNWEQDLVLKDVFNYSFVPYYHEITRNIGVKRMENYLQK